MQVNCRSNLVKGAFISVGFKHDLGTLAVKNRAFGKVDKEKQHRGGNISLYCKK